MKMLTYFVTISSIHCGQWEVSVNRGTCVSKKMFLNYFHTSSLVAGEPECQDILGMSTVYQIFEYYDRPKITFFPCTISEEITLEDRYRSGETRSFPFIVNTSTFNESYTSVCLHLVPIWERNETLEENCQSQLEETIRVSNGSDNYTTVLQYISGLCDAIGAPLPHPNTTVSYHFCNFTVV